MDPHSHDAALAAGLQAVLQVTQQLAAEEDLGRLLELIIEQACHALRCERASLFLYDPDHNELYTRKVTQLEGLEEIRLPLSAGIVGMVARERRVTHVADPYGHPLFQAHFDRETGFRTRNMLCAPLLSWKEGKLLGVLQLLNKKSGDFSPADQPLLEAFSAHAAIAIDRAVLAQHYEDKLRLMLSLDVARKIHTNLFPKELPALAGYELAAASRPADATGGDYYDVLALPQGKWGLVVADVCGHGLGPSLLMTAVRATLRAVAPRDFDPGRTLSDLSVALRDDLTATRRFVTMLYAVFHPESGLVEYANAGHGPVSLWYRAAEDRFVSLCEDPSCGCPLGVLDEEYRTCASFVLQPRDLVLMGTDGLVETRRERELFGMERLSQVVREHQRLPIECLLREVFGASTSFSAGPADDDLTLLLLRRA